MLGTTPEDPALAAEQSAVMSATPQPTLYLHGAEDGCLGVGLVTGAEAFLGAGSEVAIIEGTGHFMHVEKPEEVNRRIVEFVGT